jgi:glutaredoxin
VSVRILLAVVLFLAACQPDPAGDGRAAGKQPPLEDGGGAVVYSYVDDSGRIRMAAAVEDIPAEFRDRVVLTDTSRHRSQRLGTDRVLVVDLREAGEQGPVNFTIVDLDALGRGAPAAPSRRPEDPGELGAWVVRRMAGRVRALLGIQAPASRVRVVLYTAPWCGFCKKAAAHLRSRGIPFKERDVDSDRSAAVELSQKLRRAGLSGGGVPVLDIAGTIVIGFNRERIDRLLDKM